MAVVLHHSKAKGTNKLVLLGIANHAGDGGAWPSVETLATYANVHERNVQRSIDKLVASGELRVHVQAGGTRETPDHRRPNRYDVNVACPPWCDRTPNHRDTRKLSGRQLGLWKTRVAPAPPHASGVAPAPPHPVAQTPPEPSIEPGQPTVVSQPQDAREARPVPDWRPCAECSMPQATCEARQVKLRAEDQHHYRPGRTP